MFDALLLDSEAINYLDVQNDMDDIHFIENLMSDERYNAQMLGIKENPDYLALQSNMLQIKQNFLRELLDNLNQKESRNPRVEEMRESLIKLIESEIEKVDKELLPVKIAINNQQMAQFNAAKQNTQSQPDLNMDFNFLYGILITNPKPTYKDIQIAANKTITRLKSSNPNEYSNNPHFEQQILNGYMKVYYQNIQNKIQNKLTNKIKEKMVKKTITVLENGIKAIAGDILKELNAYEHKNNKSVYRRNKPDQDIEEIKRLCNNISTSVNSEELTQLREKLHEVQQKKSASSKKLFKSKIGAICSKGKLNFDNLAAEYQVANTHDPILKSMNNIAKEIIPPLEYKAPPQKEKSSFRDKIREKFTTKTHKLP